MIVTSANEEGVCMAEGFALINAPSPARSRSTSFALARVRTTTGGTSTPLAVPVLSSSFLRLEGRGHEEARHYRWCRLHPGLDRRPRRRIGRPEAGRPCHEGGVLLRPPRTQRHARPSAHRRDRGARARRPRHRDPPLPEAERPTDGEARSRPRRSQRRQRRSRSSSSASPSPTTPRTTAARRRSATSSSRSTTPTPSRSSSSRR